MEELLQEHHRAGYLWARQCCDFDDDRAREVLQMVYLKILEGKASFRGESDVKTWLFALIRYTAYEWKRKQRPHLSLEACQEPATEIEEDDPLFHEEMLQALAPRQRELMLLVFYHHLTLEKAAAVMGIGLGSASTHYDRAKKKLKTLIQQRKYSRDES
jgi:RNA polymerase sigma-70 factor (ECF subfamily)